MSDSASPKNTGTGSPFSRGAQHEAKRTAILSRAAKLFNTKGARSTTLADVVASSSGNLLAYGNLTTSKTVSTGDVFRFNAGAIDITVA